MLAVVWPGKTARPACARFCAQSAVDAESAQRRCKRRGTDFELQSSDASRKFWPHDFTLYARYKLGATCEIELEAHGEFETTSALHTYFNVGDIAAVKVSGLGDRFIDKVNDAKEDVLADGVQTFPDRTDRVYLNAEGCSLIHDAALNRTIEVTHSHNANVVAWNPGPALSSAWPTCRTMVIKPLSAWNQSMRPSRKKRPPKNRPAWHRASA